MNEIEVRSRILRCGNACIRNSGLRRRNNSFAVNPPPIEMPAVFGSRKRHIGEADVPERDAGINEWMNDDSSVKFVFRQEWELPITPRVSRR